MPSDQSALGAAFILGVLTESRRRQPRIWVLNTFADTVSPLLATVLDHKREAEYLEAEAAGHYRPELLFPDEVAIVGRIRQHPALLWNADNVARHLSRSNKNS
jgi:hypothetical protein